LDEGRSLSTTQPISDVGKAISCGDDDIVETQSTEPKGKLAPAPVAAQAPSLSLLPTPVLSPAKPKQSITSGATITINPGARSAAAASTSSDWIGGASLALSSQLAMEAVETKANVKVAAATAATKAKCLTQQLEAERLERARVVGFRVCT
jgi:hypothetical protein